MPEVSFELWQLLLSSGVGGISLVLLILFIPFLCLIFWFIFKQQSVLMTSFIPAAVSGMEHIVEELRSMNDKLHSMNERLETQTIILQDMYSRNGVDEKRKKIIELTRKHHVLSDVGEENSVGH